ncbi:hypothetical protein TNCT_308221 [Trichonephila clavata]|uniref:Uncharacterized protein n=1 Tax=Trichonephila clavata TaxID=2740835 RepID=A0A8X6HGA9_TRICU|nr:hypothetical protein TNCT_308221 [Trichonephila clavata]
MEEHPGRDRLYVQQVSQICVPNLVQLITNKGLVLANGFCGTHAGPLGYLDCKPLQFRSAVSLSKVYCNIPNKNMRINSAITCYLHCNGMSYLTLNLAVSALPPYQGSFCPKCDITPSSDTNFYKIHEKMDFAIQVSRKLFEKKKA